MDRDVEPRVVGVVKLFLYSLVIVSALIIVPALAVLLVK